MYLEHTENPAVSFASWAIRTLLFSVLVFVAVPLCIYIVSYLPYAQARGDVSLHTLLSVCWENQKYMLSYHSKLVATHPYSSKWWQWLFDIRPILYYREMTASGLKSAFASFNNPVVSWLGLLSVFGTAVIAVRRRSALALFIVVGYLSQLLPWIFITRLTFAYHYFPSILFLTLAVCVLMNDLMERQQDHWRLPVYGITGLSAGLYALFYPVLTGIPIPASFATHILQWFPSWPL
ncbi:hypothetical protein SDC9_61348 [bioreactor metagenome]|uniref:Protein O-mannosyl-transferase C-terminal four TM domain-containing protein n=1 Tax=bioreactor metagenome TaxID=1076179 RepID=A0A644XLL3_9ZZZZ